jgi:Tol biopolymer transport system component
VKTATFLYADGATTLVRRDLGSGLESGYDSFSPSGSHIAFFERGDLWTMKSDGTNAHRLTATPSVAEVGPFL